METMHAGQCPVESWCPAMFKSWCPAQQPATWSFCKGTALSRSPTCPAREGRAAMRAQGAFCCRLQMRRVEVYSSQVTDVQVTGVCKPDEHSVLQLLSVSKGCQYSL